jgi:hypothetical protein
MAWKHASQTISIPLMIEKRNIHIHGQNRNTKDLEYANGTSVHKIAHASKFLTSDTFPFFSM